MMWPHKKHTGIFLVEHEAPQETESIYRRTLEEFVKTGVKTVKIKDPENRKPTALAKGFRKYAKEYPVVVKQLGEDVYLINECQKN